ncbi:hypothetical protein HALO113_90193 [Halomonas sp. 113]|nr:hypothetical protein HALO113_90193 [Halomonas sp. 113]VXB82261.1 hypothetical protein HALO153_200079 [Halomonas titanicae]VXC66102.1 hypothetical protein HALO98_90194 [Halomonas titanicae]
MFNTAHKRYCILLALSEENDNERFTPAIFAATHVRLCPRSVYLAGAGQHRLFE